MGTWVKCPKCGQIGDVEGPQCPACGTGLTQADILQPAGPGQPASKPADNGIGKLIPYKNAYALASYYVGVFAIIPCLGILLGLASIPLGIAGLRHAKMHPEAHGVAHAWVGIGLGALALVANIGAIAWLRLAK